MKLHKKIIITGTLELLTGLHIGDSKDNVEIGGVDNPVVRRKDNNEPYIPGSSLKGKLRSLLEMALGEGLNSKGETSFDFENYKTTHGKTLAYMFGSSGDRGAPARLLVRDCSLTREWAKNLYDSEFTDMPYTEVKFENRIDRVKGTAEHPRQTERVPAGAEFVVQFVINIIMPTTKKDDKGTPVKISDEEQATMAKKYETDFLQLLKDGIKLLEDDYLGGSGTRGYGQVVFDFNEWTDVKEQTTTKTIDGKSKGITHKVTADYLSQTVA